MTNTQRPNCAILFVGHRLERALPGDPAGKLEVVDGHPGGGKDPSPRRYLRGGHAGLTKLSFYVGLDGRAAFSAHRNPGLGEARHEARELTSGTRAFIEAHEPADQEQTLPLWLSDACRIATAWRSLLLARRPDAAPQRSMSLMTFAGAGRSSDQGSTSRPKGIIETGKRSPLRTAAS
jgi:hypothetical protein